MEIYLSIFGTMGNREKGKETSTSAAEGFAQGERTGYKVNVDESVRSRLDFARLSLSVRAYVCGCDNSLDERTAAVWHGDDGIDSFANFVRLLFELRLDQLVVVRRSNERSY